MLYGFHLRLKEKWTFSSYSESEFEQTMEEDIISLGSILWPLARLTSNNKIPRKDILRIERALEKKWGINEHNSTSRFYECFFHYGIGCLKMFSGTTNCLSFIKSIHEFPAKQFYRNFLLQRFRKC